jgi:hypothetical protein
VVPINSSMAISSSSGVGELIERSATRLTVVLGALKTIQTHEALLSPAVRDEILRSALRHGMELQALMERARSETAPKS